MTPAATWAASLARIGSRDWLDAILDQLPVGFIIIEAPTGRVLEGNQQLERIFRHPVRYSAGVADYGEWVGYHPDGRVYAPGEWPVARALSGETTTAEEVAIDRGDGTRGYISIDAAPIRDEAGQVIAALAIIQDVTEKKLAAKRYLDLLESTTDCAVLLDREWRFSFMNQRAIREVAGGQDLTGHCVWEAFPHTAGTVFWDNYQHVMNQREPLRFEAFYPAPLNSWYEINAHPSEEGIAVFFRNINAQKQAAEAQRRSELSLHAALRAARLVTFEWDCATDFVTRSDNALDVLGIGSGPDHEFLACIHPDDRANASKIFEDALANGASVDTEMRFRRPDGRLIWLSARMQVELDEHGRLSRVFGTDQDITQRKLAEIALQEKTALLEATLDNMEQGLIMVDANGIVQVCNRRLTELLDLPREFTTAKPTFAEFMARLVANGEYAGLSEKDTPWLILRGNLLGAPPFYERSRPNGTQLEIRTVHLGNGGAVRTYTDITSRKRAEEELAQSEERYRALVSASAAIVWRGAADGSIVDVVGFQGYAEDLESVVGDGWLRLVHADDKERVISEWAAIVASEKPGEIEYRLTRSDGEVRWMSCRAVPLRNAGASVREWVGTLADIHEHKLAEEELGRSEERYRLAARAVQGVVWDWDLIKDQIQWTEAILHVFGYLPEAVDPAGQWWVDRIHPDDRDNVLSGINSVIGGTTSHWSAEYRFQRADGAYAHVFDRGFMMRDAEGNPLRMVGALQDLTERLRLEEQLRQSQKMEAVGQLTGGIAHDFNNLLTVILGNAEILADEIADPGLQGLARMTEETASRAAELTQKLLAFGRRQTLKPEPIVLDQVVYGMVGLLKRTLGEHVEIRLATKESQSAALTDRTLLESALLNLAVNARDAMPKGGTLTISCGERTAVKQDGNIPAGQPVVYVTVADTGCGMPPDVLAHAFEPFFTTKDVGQGTGLGLAMVYGFAEQSGGHVSIESQEGQGTSVTIVLRAVGKEDGRLAEDDCMLPTNGGERVLVVEDEPGVRVFVEAQLNTNS
jgi:PAS domain S-box-containing protein